MQSEKGKENNLSFLDEIGANFVLDDDFRDYLQENSQSNFLRIDLGRNISDLDIMRNMSSEVIEEVELFLGEKIKYRDRPGFEFKKFPLEVLAVDLAIAGIGIALTNYCVDSIFVDIEAQRDLLQMIPEIFGSIGSATVGGLGIISAFTDLFRKGGIYNPHRNLVLLDKNFKEVKFFYLCAHEISHSIHSSFIEKEIGYGRISKEYFFDLPGTIVEGVAEYIAINSMYSKSRNSGNLNYKDYADIKVANHRIHSEKLMKKIEDKGTWSIRGTLKNNAFFSLFEYSLGFSLVDYTMKNNPGREKETLNEIMMGNII